MKNRMLLSALATVLLSSCLTEEVDTWTDQFKLERITVNSIYEDYNDDTLFEGGPDIYLKIYLDEVLIATTETDQNTSLPEIFSDELPFEFFPDDMGKELRVKLYDRDPSEDDFIGEVWWGVESVQEDSSVLVSNGDNQISLRFTN